MTEGYKAILREVILMDSNEEAELQQFDETLAQLIESFIKENGPHEGAEIAEWLYQNQEVYTVISGSLYKLPESNVEYVLDASPHFARDGTGRWHLKQCD